MTDAIRVVFMGTPLFAVPALHGLANAGYSVVAVVTQPDRAVGRKRVVTPSPVKEAALALNVPVLQPNRVRSEESLASIRSLHPDVIVTAAYGQILPQALLDIPRIGSLNIHASLLPRWRGAAPIHRAIMHGDKETGVAVMEMVLALDAGPVYGVRKTPIRPDDDVQSVHDRVADLGAALLLAVLPGYTAGTLQPVQQVDDGVTYAHRILREDEFIDWNRPAQDVLNHIRGLSPWPGATADLPGGQMKIWRAMPSDNDCSLAPGEVRRTVDAHVLVGCADGNLRLCELQPAGKRKMDAVSWFRGLQLERVQFQLPTSKVNE